MKSDFNKLLCNALPPGLTMAMIMRSVSEGEALTEEDVYRALRTTPYLDWEMYRNANSDLRDANVDPVIHYMKHGIFEGRQLITRDPSSLGYGGNTTKVSIIIANYNNSLYLAKCIDSIVSQTISDIEIIVVDDASTDNSLTILNKYLEADSRVKLIQQEKNSGQHNCQKLAVSIAIGQYIMFCDADDFLLPNACEVAYKAICGKYDIVCFNSSIVTHRRQPKYELCACEQFLNHNNSETFYGREILSAIFEKRYLSFTLWNKIYDRNLCKTSYDLMDECRLVNHDTYAVFVIASRAKSLKTITDTLIVYNYGVGMSFPDTSETRLDNYMTIGDIGCFLERYTDKYGNKSYLKKIVSDCLTHSISTLIEKVPDKLVNKYLSMILQQYGIIEVVIKIFDLYHSHWSEVARKIEHFKQFKPYHDIKTVGIFFHKFAYGGVGSVIVSLCKCLINSGYSVVLFVEDKELEAPELPDDVMIVYVADSTHYVIPPHIITLYEQLQTNRVDIMLYQAGSSPALLWDIILLKCMNIPIITTLHECFSQQLSSIFYTNYNINDRDNTYRCADKIICLSKYAEIYLRMRGVDATYLPNPVNIYVSNMSRCRRKKVIVIARFSDPIKQINEALKVFNIVANDIPETELCLIGDFDSDQDRDKFYGAVTTYGLEHNVHLTGWTKTPNYFMETAMVLLSTSCSEGFPLNIAEGLALGIPCVMYALPIELANNKAVFSVPQGDHASAAKIILTLLTDNTMWEKASKYARDSVGAYSSENYCNKINELLTTFGKCSPWLPLDRSSVTTVLNSIITHAIKGCQIIKESKQ